MKVLIVGGAGFIGSHLTRSLAEAGHVVVVADNLVTARSLDLLGPARARVDFHHVDIRCPEDFLGLPAGPYDRVYHLAASYANALSVQNPRLDLRTNVEGTLNVLDFARRAGTGIFVYTGSSSSYGDVPLPFDEEGPMRPQTPYALHKQMGEWHVRASGLRHAIFRLFNVYGPGDPPGRYRNVIPTMIVAAGSSSDATLRIYGDKATRDFNYIDDVIAILADPERAAGQTINIGTGVEVSVIDLARKILMLFDLPEERLRREPPRDWDGVVRRCADVRRLRALYGEGRDERARGHATSLDEGLKRTARWLFEAGHLSRRPR
ncbi:MAG: NAD-dependent epimerase/dehydratase family protein [Byssovorax sp.]